MYWNPQAFGYYPYPQDFREIPTGNQLSELRRMFYQQFNSTNEILELARENRRLLELLNERVTGARPPERDQVVNTVQLEEK